MLSLINFITNIWPLISVNIAQQFLYTFPAVSVTISQRECTQFLHSVQNLNRWPRFLFHMSYLYLHPFFSPLSKWKIYFFWIARLILLPIFLASCSVSSGILFRHTVSFFALSLRKSQTHNPQTCLLFSLSEKHCTTQLLLHYHLFSFLPNLLKEPLLSPLYFFTCHTSAPSHLTFSKVTRGGEIPFLKPSGFLLSFLWIWLWYLTILTTSCFIKFSSSNSR